MTAAIHDHSRWGSADRLGAANLITAESRLAAISLVRKGSVYPLGRMISPASPFLAPNQTPYVISTGANWTNVIRRRRELGTENDPGANLERVELNMHTGTHIDALGHYSTGDRLYGGRDARDTVGDFGLRDLGIECCPPIVARGVCLDLSGLDGAAPLQPGRVIEPGDLARASAAAGVEIGVGDVVCLHTGWGRHYAVDNARYCAGEPGIDVPAARWLTERDVLAVGADSMAVEVLPNPRHPKIVMPVHQHCLVERGVYLIENLFLDELVRDHVHVFCFILLPVPFQGATGSPAQPIAMI